MATLEGAAIERRDFSHKVQHRLSLRAGGGLVEGENEELRRGLKQCSESGHVLDDNVAGVHLQQPFSL